MNDRPHRNRYAVQLTSEELRLLQDLKEALSASSRSEVVRRSIRVMRDVLESSEGRRIATVGILEDGRPDMSDIEFQHWL